MITERDLQEAIAECQGTRNPGASTCLKLASYYTILDHTQRNNDVQPSYSFASEPGSNSIDYKGKSEFVQIINGKNINEVLSVMDELMSTLQVLNPRLYNGVISKL
jgi:hypothetical protein